MRRAFVFYCAAGVLIACAGARAPARVPAHAPSAFLPARIRPLSNLELQNSVSALLGTASDVAQRMPPDVRQSGYTRNASQAWTATRAVRWAALVEEQAGEAVNARFDALWPCNSQSPPTCRAQAVDAAVLRAWRRPATPGERSALLRVYTELNPEGERAAVAALYSALMQAPSFVYASELGPSEATQAPLVRLGPYEVASQLSFMLRAMPPDAELLEAARSGVLDTPGGREAQAWRLLSENDTRHQFRRFVLEWLEVDRLAESARDAERYPAYERLKLRMLDETANTVDEVMVHHGASVTAVLDAGFTSVDPSMARYYGLQAYGPAVALSGTQRRGVLQHASVLAAHSHPDVSSPVKRGDFILRRVLCTQLPRPAELGIEIVMPRPQAGQTGRERISAHSVNPGCASCHDTIDPLGFAFENFDAAGAWRDQEGGRPTDARVVWTRAGEKHNFNGSVELSRWLAHLPETQRCFARQAFRYFSAQTSLASEEAFVALRERLPDGQKGNLASLLVEYVKSDLFIWRHKT